MKLEEIKQQYQMSDILRRYGLKETRSHFIRCPFHSGDNTPSLKVYKDNFHCFGCGANGDIFTFVQLMENCSFRDAFVALGGTYDKPRPSELINQYRMKQSRRARKQREKEKADQKRMLLDEITECRDIIENNEVFSDEWTQAKQRLTILLARLEEGGEGNS